jgi:hypothetical protein
VSSSRNSSSAAAALPAITAAIRSEKMRERIILWLQRRRKGNMAMPAFPGRGKLDVREKAVGSCVERGAATPVDSHARYTQTDGTRIPSSTISFDAHVISSIHTFFSDPSPVHPDQGSSNLMSFPSKPYNDKNHLSPRDRHLVTWQSMTTLFHLIVLRVSI